MALTDGGGLSAADVAAVTGHNGYGSNGFGWGDGSFWIIILFLFALMGNNGFGFGGFGGGNGYMANCVNNDVQRGFDQSAVMNGITSLGTAVNNGFANAEVSRCNAQANLLQAMNTNQAAVLSGMNANQMATITGMNTLANSLQQCCCDNRAGLADLKYTVATENCADRAAVSDGIRDIITANNSNTQAILDKLCALELDGVKQRNADLLAENSALKFAQSQTAQTAKILADNAAQTVALEQYLNPAPVPAYVVQNPSCCNNVYTGCGCGA